MLVGILSDKIGCQSSQEGREIVVVLLQVIDHGLVSRLLGFCFPPLLVRVSLNDQLVDCLYRLFTFDDNLISQERCRDDRSASMRTLPFLVPLGLVISTLFFGFGVFSERFFPLGIVCAMVMLCFETRL